MAKDIIKSPWAKKKPEQYNGWREEKTNEWVKDQKTSHLSKGRALSKLKK